jgi:16S rRNA (guanine527-N7)-methyltransferase
MQPLSIKDVLARLRHDPLLAGATAEVVVEHRSAPGGRRSLVFERRGLQLGPGGFSVAGEPFIPYHRVLSIRCCELIWERDAGFVSRPRRAAGAPAQGGGAPDSQLRRELARWGVSVDDRAWQTLGLYRELIQKGNRIHNLVSRSMDRGKLERLIVESLLALPALGCGRCRLLDVGSGAGLPGLPLAIVSPALEVTLLEPSAKRSGFLRSALEALEMDSVPVITARIEDSMRRRFQAVCVRGLKWRPRAEAMAGVLEPGGVLLSYEAPSRPEPGVAGWKPAAQITSSSVVVRLWQAPRST